MNVWQHTDLVHERQGCRLAHPEKPVLGRGYVRDTSDVRYTSHLRHIQGSGDCWGIVVHRRLHEWRRRQIFCRLTG